MMSTVLQDLRNNSSGTYLTLCSPLSSTSNLLMLLVSSLYAMHREKKLTMNPQALTMTSNAETRCTLLLTVCPMLTMLLSGPSSWYDPNKNLFLVLIQILT